ncbi:heme peroxidase [Macleaya cordata]|uniref:Heme peroxidase n=1 Tax=Macleaya cordata TaxID=56857 RepID=A0A200RA53_MACCD|nr:heme peroxidase [Macleaya cordata]
MDEPVVDQGYLEQIEKARQYIRTCMTYMYNAPPRMLRFAFASWVGSIKMDSRVVFLRHDPVVDEEYLRQIQKARRALRAHIYTKNCAPILFRLAWNDAGTYDVKTKTGGANGSIRNSELLKRDEYSELEKASHICAIMKIEYPRITYADLIQLAGVVAVEVTGGPEIDFVPGRKDSLACPEEGRIPDANQGVQQKMDTFYRMGLSDHKDIVALSGGLTLGRKEQERQGYDDGALPTPKPVKFDNSFFVELLKAEAEGLLIHPADRVLLEDHNFRHYVELYAKNEDAFFGDYAVSHKKFSELGFTPNSSSEDHKVVERSRTTVLVQRFLPVAAISAAVVVLSYLFEVHRRVK